MWLIFQQALNRLRHEFPLVLSLAAAVATAGEWEQGQNFRSKSLEIVPEGQTGFTLLSPEATGISFGNFVPESKHLTNQIFLNGSGVAAGDVDGDGWCDLYFCGLSEPNRLYRNLGNWRFQDITETARVACPGLDATGAALADLDGDGDLDLIVNSVGGGTHLFTNDGQAHFGAITPASGLNSRKGGTSMALGDIDGDGYLDLYVANYRTSALMDIPNARATFKTVDGKTIPERLNGRPTTEPDLTNRFVINERGVVEELGEEDVLYRSRNGTNFIPMAFTQGAFLDEAGNALKQAPRDWGLSVMFRDINADGLPDIYVCNDFETPDRMWFNLGQGRFQAIGPLAIRKSSFFSMGVDFADVNRDGFDDFFVLDMLPRDHRQRMRQMGTSLPSVTTIGQIESRPQYMISMLFLNRGDGTYAEVGQLSGLEATDWAWLPIFLDVDLDGWEDILVAAGQERAARDMDVADQLRAMRVKKRMSDAQLFQARRMFPRLDSPILAFRNRGDLTFEEVGSQWGFKNRGVSHGMALADLDNDGDLDVAVNHFNAAAGIYRNDTTAPRLAVRLKGQAPNTRGIGAKIRILGGPVPMQSQEMICGGRYMSCDDTMRVFAAGSATSELAIEILWCSGRRSVVRGAKANRVYELDETGPLAAGNARAPVSSSAGAPAEPDAAWVTDHASRAPLFEDVSDLIRHVHREEAYNDFVRQPLLANRLCQLGPGAAWFDVDGDGREDLAVGSGKGGQLGIYRNNPNGEFTKLDGPPLSLPVTRDQTTVLGWIQAPGQVVLLAGSSNYEDGLAVGGCVRKFDLGQKRVEDLLPGRQSSTGPLTLADVDGDGDLDLFVGGRALPGKYPSATASALFRNTGGAFEPDIENGRRLSEVGLVSGAVFSDLNGDGFPELILACDWGPVRVFRNDRGNFIDATRELGLSDFKGWWNGVTTGDFDGDGNLDIAASNWGRNTKYESHRQQPLRVFFGDFDGDGTQDIIEAYYDSSTQKMVPVRQLEALGRAIPPLRERFPTNKSFAEAGVEELLGVTPKAAKFWEANWLESTVFLNRGDRFEARPLPVEAQFAPAFGVCAGDYDGDGREDIFLSQNFFAVTQETPRHDAGRGLWLRGDGKGGWVAVSGQESGVNVYGEQRGCALGDFDNDGRVDLVVTQNQAATKLFRNRGALPGLRVRLKGSDSNPNGIGATLRLVIGPRMGAAREIHAGSGYWSQDSSVQVMASAEFPTRLWVRWPGGKVVLANIPANAREISVDATGQLTVVR